MLLVNIEKKIKKNLENYLTSKEISSLILNLKKINNLSIENKDFDFLKK